MFANMQEIVVALLVVASVPARVLATSLTDDFVLELFDATDRHLVGSLKFAPSEVTQPYLTLEVNKPFKFTSKHPYVALLLYKGWHVWPGCRTTAPPMQFDDGKPVVVYSGWDKDIINKADYKTSFERSGDLMDDNNFVNAMGVMFSVSPEDPKPSPIACGLIGPAGWGNNFLNGLEYIGDDHKPTLRSFLRFPPDADSVLERIEAVTDLYYASSGAFAGWMIHQTYVMDDLLTAVLPSDLEWGNGAAVAIVYLAKHVQPGCVTSGPAVARIHEATNDFHPLVLFIADIAEIHKPILARATMNASVSSLSKYNLVDHAVVVYSLPSTDSSVLHDFLQPTNTHMPIACGSIRYADAAEDNFLQWTPAGPKPIRTPETVKLSLIADALGAAYKIAREKDVHDALKICGLE